MLSFLLDIFLSKKYANIFPRGNEGRSKDIYKKCPLIVTTSKFFDKRQKTRPDLYPPS